MTEEQDTGAGQLMADAVNATEAAALIPGGVARLNQDLVSVASRLASYDRDSRMAIATEQDRDEAVEIMRRITMDGKDVAGHEILSQIIQSLHCAHRQWCSVRDSILKPLKDGKDRLGGAVMAAERAWAQAAEAERARLQAIADAEAARERARLEKEAAKLKTPELKAARIEAAAAVVAAPVYVQGPAKSRGATTANRWQADATDMAALICAAAGGDKNARRFLVFDAAVARDFARSTNGDTAVPGVVFRQVAGMRVQGR